MEKITRQPTEEQERMNIDRTFPRKDVPLGKMTHSLKLEEIMRNCAFSASLTDPSYEARTQLYSAVGKTIGFALPIALITGLSEVFKSFSNNDNTKLYLTTFETIGNSIALLVGRRDLIGSFKFAYAGNGTYSLGVIDHLRLYNAWRKIGRMQKNNEIRTGDGQKRVSDRELYYYDCWSGGG